MGAKLTEEGTGQGTPSPLSNPHSQRHDAPRAAPHPPLQQIPAHIQTLADYERLAPSHMPAAIWQHIQSGAGQEHSLSDNRTSFDRYQLIPQSLRDMRGASTQIDLLGQRMAAPLFLAPIAYHRLAHPDGEIAAMRAATAMGVPMMVSTLSSYRLEDIADAARHAAQTLGQPCPPLWFQLYWQPNIADNLSLIRRAEAAGYGHIIFTVDAAIKRTALDLPDDVIAANLRDMPRLSLSSAPHDGHILFGSELLQAAPTWDSLSWLRQATKLPLIVKGILSAEDARKAADHGADGVVISNHGGRVLDDLLSPLTALPSVRQVLGPDYPILIDSGFRTGSDIIKALALGANAVLIGRPQIHALAVAGMQGCAHMLHLLRAELELAMAQLGRKTPAELGPDLLWDRQTKG